MGYVTCFGRCYQCRTTFSFNPYYVPSLTIAGSREPFCRSCVEAANAIRKASGMAPLVIHPQAYEPAQEGPEEDY